MPGFSKWDWSRNSGNKKTRHVEVDGAIVNIHTGLKDRFGRKVTAVEIIPDEHNERKWKVIPGKHNTRIIQLKHKPRKKKSKKNTGLIDYKY